MASKSVAVLGVGFMGRGIAKNIILKGGSAGLESCYLFDINPNQISSLIAEINQKSELAVARSLHLPLKVNQIHSLTSPKDVLNKVDVVSMSLPSEEACFTLLFHEKDGIIVNHTSPGGNKEQKKYILDHSTYSRKFVMHCAGTAKKFSENIRFIDAPVSGGPQGALNGTLSVMIGGSQVKLASLLPYLKLFSAKQSFFGDVGKAYLLILFL
jgi:3-hydroxyisobutyrate dehydrogenase